MNTPSIAGSVVRSRLGANRKDFEDLLSRAEFAHRRHRYAEAAIYAQMASNLAWLNHGGFFTSQRLERLLRDLGRSVPSHARTFDSRTEHNRPAQSRRILHVVSAVYKTGGHTRMLARWIRLDDDSISDVIVTRQPVVSAHEVLVQLGTPVSRVISVFDHARSIMESARLLREAAQDVDLVILHLHPDDVIPAMAFTGPHRHPPVIFVNHADHVFWIGVSVANVLMNLRVSGQALAISRRHVDADRCRVMTRPLDSVKRTMSRESAKAELGIASGTVVLVTVAAGTKFDPIGGVAFLDLVAPVLADHADVVLLAAGPSDVGAWAASRLSTEGRVIALGEIADPTVVHHAADIYLDSFPFSSLTSIFESGGLGNPVLTYRGHPAEAAVLGADSPGLDNVILSADTPEGFRKILNELVADEGWREEVGDQTRKSVEQSHCASLWRSNLEDLYRDAIALDREPSIGDESTTDGSLDQLVCLTQLQTGHAFGLAGAIGSYANLMPWPVRLRLINECRRLGHPIDARLLISPWSMRQIHRISLAIRRTLAQIRG